MAAVREWEYDGTRGRLAARAWQGEAPTYVVVLAHGYGEHAGRYEAVADALVRSGAAVVAVDHVGHGRSAGERALVEDVEDVVTDLRALEQTARREHPGLPVVLLGHSMGGLVAARHAQRHGDGLAALVLSGPLIGRWEAGPALLAMEEIPDAPLDIGTLSRDPAVGEAYAADPVVWHGPFRRATLAALDRAVRAVQEGPGLGDLPTLWVHGEDDRLVPVEGTRVGIEHLRGSRLTTRTYPGARHEVLNETNAGEVLDDVVAFLADVLPEAVTRR